MKKTLSTLIISTLLLIVTFCIYYRYSQKKSLLNSNISFIPNNTIALYYTNDLDKTWNEFSKTTIYKHTHNSDFVQFFEATKRLINNFLKLKNVHTAIIPVFISFHLNEEKNDLEYILYFPKIIISANDSLNTNEIVSIKTQFRGRESFIHYIDTNTYIIVSKYKTTLSKYLESINDKQNNLIVRNIDPKRCALIIDPQNLKNFINILFLDRYLLPNLDSILDSLSEQTVSNFRVTNKCVALNGLIKTNKSIIPYKTDWNNNYTKPDLKKYCTINTNILELIYVPNLEEYLDIKSKLPYSLTDSEKMFIASIASEIKGDMAYCSLNTLDSTIQNESILFIATHDARLFTDILLANNSISMQESTKNSLPFYFLKESVFTNYIIERLFSNSKFYCMTILDNCIILSTSPSALASWYELYMRQKLWDAPNRLTTDNADLCYLIDIQKCYGEIIHHIDPELQHIANIFLSKIGNIALQITKKESDLYKVSIMLSYQDSK